MREILDVATGFVADRAGCANTPVLPALTPSERG